MNDKQAPRFARPFPDHRDRSGRCIIEALYLWRQGAAQGDDEKIARLNLELANAYTN